jgi:hypothetical protein
MERVIVAMVDHAGNFHAARETFDAEVEILADGAFDANALRDVDATIIAVVLAATTGLGLCCEGNVSAE